MQADSTRSTMFKVLLEALRQKYGKVAFVTGNAAPHKSELIKKYLKSTGGDVILIYLPPYTPQLNPIEIQWWMIKARLAARYYQTEDEMEDSIIRLVESGEVQPVRISGLPMARPRRGGPAPSSRSGGTYPGRYRAASHAKTTWCLGDTARRAPDAGQADPGHAPPSHAAAPVNIGSLPDPTCRYYAFSGVIRHTPTSQNPLTLGDISAGRAYQDMHQCAFENCTKEPVNPAVPACEEHLCRRCRMGVTCMYDRLDPDDHDYLRTDCRRCRDFSDLEQLLTTLVYGPSMKC